MPSICDRDLYAELCAVLQGPTSVPVEQQGEPGQMTPAKAYEQLASLLRANPDASPLIAQALQNMSQHGVSGQPASFTEILPGAYCSDLPHTDSHG